MGEESSRIREEIEETRDRMSGTVDALSDKADVGKRVKENVADKRDRLMSQMQGTASRVSDATPDAEDVREGARQAVGVAQENPIGLAIGGAAAGFLAGMVLSSTRIENERLGPVSDQLKDRARSTGEEVVERGRQVAQDTVDAVKDSANEAAENVTGAVKESGQQQTEELRAGS
jgi:ElaB/YqjD/DUF883 family membrane-anchored ribosome-binding protein